MKLDGVLKNLVALGASWVLWVLVALSIVACAVIFERLVFFFRTREDSLELAGELSRFLDGKGPWARGRRSLESSSIEACIVNAGVGALAAKEAEERMAGEMQMQRLRAERSLAFLGTLGNNAPFVGLLGTVIGIIGAFEQLDASGGQLTSGLMTEIGEALIATAVGLLVALPAVAAYNTFQRTIAVRLSRGDALGRLIVASRYGQLVSGSSETEAGSEELHSPCVALDVVGGE